MVESWPVTPVGAGSTPVFPDRLAIHLSKDDVLGTNDGHHIRKHVMLGHEIQGLEMDKAWSTDLTPVGLVSTIGHQVDTKLPPLELQRLHTPLLQALPPLRCNV